MGYRPARYEIGAKGEQKLSRASGGQKKGRVSPPQDPARRRGDYRATGLNSNTLSPVGGCMMASMWFANFCRAAAFSGL